MSPASEIIKVINLMVQVFNSAANYDNIQNVSKVILVSEYLCCENNVSNVKVTFFHRYSAIEHTHTHTHQV